MLNFADKLKPFFSITSSWVGPHSPDPLTHFPPSTQVPSKKLSQPEVPSSKVSTRNSISHSVSTTVIRSNLFPEADAASNSLMIRSLLDSLQVSLRVLVMQQPKTCTHKPPVVLFDSLDMTSCGECQQTFQPEQMSELIFGNCYISTPSGLKLQTLHSNCILLSRVIYHNAQHLVRSNQSSTQILPTKLAFSLNPPPTSECTSLGVRCKTATSRRNIEKEMHVFNKPLSSSLDSKRPAPFCFSPANSWAFEESVLSINSTRVSSPTRPVSVESLTSPHRSVTKPRRLAIVLIFHERDRGPPQINDLLQSHFLSLENSINMLADNMYDVIDSTTETSFRPSLAVAVEEFLTDISSQLVHGKMPFSLLPLQLYDFDECPVRRIPLIVANLHARLNCGHMDNLFSRLLTAFLTYHHSWLVSMIQQAKNSDVKHETLSSHIEVLASRYGYSPSSPFLCKVLLVDQCNQFSQEILSQIIILFSYLFRYKINDSHTGTSPTRELTPSNEDFLIISMGTDVFNSPTNVQPKTNTNNTNIQCYTYNPAELQNTVTTNDNYAQVPLASDNTFSDILEEARIPPNSSILNYTTSDRNVAILHCLSELRDLYSHLERGSTHDELFSIEDNLYEGDMFYAMPPPTLIIADLSELSVEVIHTDTSLVDWKFKESVLSKARPQKHSKLVHSLVEMTCSILEPLDMLEDEESRQEAQVVSCEIALLCLESSLEDLYTKAELVVKHLKSWLEWEQGIEDRARTHDLFSELISLLRVDLSDLELLLRLASVVAPEERSAFERLSTFLSAYY